MLTIFSIPKPFRGHVSVIQRNAIRSWLRLSPKCEVILLGDEKGVVRVASEFNIRHIPEIKKNGFGTPLLNSAFNLTQKLATNNIMVYVNTDIILMSDFIPAIQSVKKPLFLVSGQRWDLDIKDEIEFDETNWEDELGNLIAKEGKLHGFSGIDYFIFPRNLQHNLPSFVVGRPGWDNWLIYRIRSLGIPVIDATKVITVVHQNHDYSHCIGGDRNRGPEAQRNFDLAGGFSNMLNLREANWVLTKNGLRKPGFPRRIFVKLSLFYPWRSTLSVKRKLQQLLR